MLSHVGTHISKNSGGSSSSFLLRGPETKISAFPRSEKSHNFHETAILATGPP